MALLDGRVAVVTGAGRGFSRAHALAPSAPGAARNAATAEHNHPPPGIVNACCRMTPECQILT
jgi:NAD(P)-dependent dehydrogenase (short-subunit alcohol dehydrogenase family)